MSNIAYTQNGETWGACIGIVPFLDGDNPNIQFITGNGTSKQEAFDALVEEFIKLKTQ